MKSGIAGALILIGLILLGSSMFVGKNISADQEYTEEQQEVYAQLTVTGHMPAASKAEEAEKERARAELLKQQAEAQALVEAKKKKGKTLYMSGIVVALVGVAVQGWAWADRRE